MTKKGKAVGVALVCAWILVIAALIAGKMSHIQDQPIPAAHASSLQAQITPRNVKLAVGQKQVFSLLIDGSPPYQAGWKVNGTRVADGLTYEFWFEEPAAFIVLTVEVQDSFGNVAFDATYVYDPFTAPDIYLDALPSTADYVVDTDGTYFWATKWDGQIPSGMSGTNDDTVIQYAIDNTTTAGGSVFIRPGSYSASITLKDHVRLILDQNATGVTITIDSGATCWIEDYNAGRTRYYSSGTLMYDENQASGEIVTATGNFTTVCYVAELNMSGNIYMDQNWLVKGVMDQGTSFPSSPVTGQWFFRTDLSEAYIYDGSSWIVSAPAGAATGSQVEEASYIVFLDGSTYKMKNGTSGAIDWSSTNASAVINACTANSTDKGKIALTAGTFIIDSTIWMYDEIWLQGAGINSTVLYLADNSDCDMISENGADSVYRCRISDMRLEGNKGNQASGSGIDVSAYLSVFDHLYINEVNDDGLSLNALKGIYSSYSALADVHHVQVRDAGGNGIALKSADCRLTDCFVWSCDTNILVQSSGCSILGSHFADADGTGYGAYVRGAESRFVDCAFETSLVRNVFIKPFDSGPSANNIIFSGCSFARAGKYATGWDVTSVYVDGHSSYPIKGLQFVACDFYEDLATKRGGKQIYLMEHITGATIDACTFTAANSTTAALFVHDNSVVNCSINDSVFSDLEASTDAIYINNADYTNIRDNTFIDCPNRGVYIGSGGDYTFIDGNDFRGCSTDCDGDLTSVIWGNNVNFVNSGTATDKANGGTVAHGLAGTPTLVQLTALNATYEGNGTVVAWDKANSDGTNISLDIYWSNGTAITDSAIDVAWYAEYEP